MSLIKCIECGNEVSEFAEICPKCGCPINIILNASVNCCNKFKIDNNEYDLKDFNKKVDSDTLQSVTKIARMLMNEYKIPGAHAKLIGDIIAFNNNQIPADYNETLEQMRANNRARIAQSQASKPKCPTCGSMNIRKIGAGERVASVVGLGLLSKKINKTWKCNNCGHTW